MADQTINALVLGDVIGHPGCRALFIHLKKLIKDTKADIVIVNGENAADGFGITVDIAEQFFGLGVDIITTGNHVWQKREILPYMDRKEQIIRPANYPPGAPGNGYCIIEKGSHAIAVVNLQGRDNLSTIDCPFRCAGELIRKIKKDTEIIIIDFHAESAKEKESLAYYVDGTASAVLGTHTHIQTADERILKGGTAYITDIGMTGPEDSVIGVDPESAVNRSLTQMPLKLEVIDTAAVINGAVLRIDSSTGKCEAIERIRVESGM